MRKVAGLSIAAAVGGVMFFGLVGFADEIELGTALPAVAAPNQDGKMVDLAAAGGKGWTLVYFYPKADTPGCTKQACSLRDAHEPLTAKGVTVYGVSADSVAAQKAFHTKYKLTFDVLADTDKKVMDAFGVPHLMGVAKREAYLFKDGKLVWRDTAAKTEGQAADVLAAMEKLGSQTS
jgi:peroxiredoxin Q/BCP